jgi:hypothetical protein
MAGGRVGAQGAETEAAQGAAGSGEAEAGSGRAAGGWRVDSATSMLMGEPRCCSSSSGGG